MQLIKLKEDKEEVCMPLETYQEWQEMVDEMRDTIKECVEFIHQVTDYDSGSLDVVVKAEKFIKEKT